MKRFKKLIRIIMYICFGMTVLLLGFGLITHRQDALLDGYVFAADAVIAYFVGLLIPD